MKLVSCFLGLILSFWLIAHEAVIPTKTITIEPEPIIRGKLYHPGNAVQFKDMLDKFEFVVVDFYADWCQPCKQMHKVFDSFAQDAELDDVLFIKVNTDIHHTISNDYNIRSLPTIILFVDGKPIKYLYGSQDKQKLKKIIKETFRFRE